MKSYQFDAIQSKHPIPNLSTNLKDESFSSLPAHNSRRDNRRLSEENLNLNERNQHDHNDKMDSEEQMEILLDLSKESSSDGEVQDLTQKTDYDKLLEMVE